MPVPDPNTKSGQQPGYNAKKDADGSWHVETRTGRVVKRGFANRAAANSYIADLMVVYKNRKK